MYHGFNVTIGGVAVGLSLLFGGELLAVSKLVCEEPSYDFGEREEGESVEHMFVVKNVGDVAADIKKLRPSCGCAAIRAEQDNLAPGAETAVTVKMSLGKGRGLVRKSLTVVSADDQQEALTLTLEGFVTSTLYVMPERLELGQIDADKEVTRSVVVAFAQEEPVKITRTMSDVDTMVSEVETLKEGGLYRVTVRIRPQKGSSRIQARVLLYTDSAKHPMVDIPVIGTVVGDLAAVPNELVLAGDPGQSVTRYVVLLSPKHKAFEIKEVLCPTPSVKAEVKPMGAGYRLELSGLTATSDLHGKSVVVKTTLNSFPSLQIPLHIRRPAEAQVPVPSGAQPVVEGAFRLDERSVNRGKVRMGEPVEHTFRLLNTSNETRHIVKVTPGCGCAKVLRFSKDIAPQAWGEVVVALDTTGSAGIRQSSVLIETDDPNAPRLNPLLTCQVLPAIETSPTQLLLTSEASSIPGDTHERDSGSR